MTKVRFHGELGKSLGKKEWELCVDSTKEALHAINIKTNKKLNKLFIEGQKVNTKYSLLINEEEIMLGGDEKLGNKEETFVDDMKKLGNSSVYIKRKELKTIDVIPVIEGSDDGVGMLLMGVLMVGLALLNPAFLGMSELTQVMVFAAGASLVGTGIAMMMMQPPEFSEVKKIAGMTAGSYLFNGPVNIVREGNPVPVIYGEILAGSNVIGQYMDVTHVTAGDGQVVS